MSNNDKKKKKKVPKVYANETPFVWSLVRSHS